MSNYGEEPERVCELECRGLQGLPARHEFVGPVKIVLIESTPMDYRFKVCWSAMVTMSLLFLGVPAFTLFYYTLYFKLPRLVNLHIFLCTMGLQLFMVPGILMHSTFFGGAMFLNPHSRRFQHFLLQSAAVLFSLAGTVIMVSYMTCSVHALTGFFGVLFSLFAVVLGPGAYYSSSTRPEGRFNRKLHMYFGLPSFILCSLCFLSCFAENKFITWLGNRQYHFVLVAMVLFHFVSVLGAIYLKAKSES
ncbi:uncharacterized protein LOC118267588 [Spodoptera frugiperda]|uniref:Uncharacterized protein LOC118267588 n=1 Tax=Spodoptera frugiperda TaxID=7108 RepID=A0A9R0D247_SPOFR|nr:uncharacterized protein LOC118267588 [Spodoptera frugiperda]